MQIVDEFLLQIFRKVPKYGLMPDMYELQGLRGSCTGSGWDLLLWSIEYHHVRMNSSYLHRYKFIEYSLFLGMIWW